MDDVATETDPDTGTNDTAEAIDSTTTTADADSTATADSAQSDSPATTDAPGSLASGAEATNTPPTQQPSDQAEPPRDWKKAHDGQYQANQRLTAERKELQQRESALQTKLKELEEKLTGVDLQQVRQFQQHQQASKNPIWHPSHPEHARFRDALATHNHYVRLASRAPAEQRDWINAQYDADLSAEDRANIQRFMDHGKQQLISLQQDPEGYVQERVAKLVDEKIREFQQTTVGNYRENLEARTDLGNLLQKYPELNKPEHLERAQQMVQQGIPMASALAEIRMGLLEKRLSGAEQAKRSVETKERLMQANSSISRDPAVNPSVDIYAEAKKIAEQRKIKNPWDPRFMRILDDLNRKYQTKG